MHRTLTAVALVAAASSALVAPGAFAQGDPAIPSDGHRFVGAWLVDTNTGDVSDPPARLAVHPDGTLLQADQAHVAIGVWEPTGDHSAALTFTAQVDVGDGQVATLTVRAAVEIDGSGAGWTGEATVEQTGPDGSASGQMGPIPAAATRIVVEPMGPATSPAL